MPSLPPKSWRYVVPSSILKMYSVCFGWKVVIEQFGTVVGLLIETAAGKLWP